jgi:hypothetical protein
VPLVRLNFRAPRAISATYNRFVRFEDVPDESKVRTYYREQNEELVEMEVVSKD